MSRLFRIVSAAVAVFAAARSASAAVVQHRMPDDAALKQLGIAPADMRKVRF